MQIPKSVRDPKHRGAKHASASYHRDDYSTLCHARLLPLFARHLHVPFFIFYPVGTFPPPCNGRYSTSIHLPRWLPPVLLRWYGAENMMDPGLFSVPAPP